MKYRDVLIPKTKQGLAGFISVAMLHVPLRKDFEQSIDFEGFFYSIERGIENLRKRFGDSKANQLLEMIRTAKLHYEKAGKHTRGTPANLETQLAGQLMEDAKMVVLNRQPWAYPKDLYRWPIAKALPELSEADILDKDELD